MLNLYDDIPDQYSMQKMIYDDSKTLQDLINPSSPPGPAFRTPSALCARSFPDAPAGERPPERARRRPRAPRPPRDTRV